MSNIRYIDLKQGYRISNRSIKFRYLRHFHNAHNRHIYAHFTIAELSKSNYVCWSSTNWTSFSTHRNVTCIIHRHSNSGPPLFPHLVPPAIMVWIFVWKYIFEPFIHILQHFVLQLSGSTNFCF